MSIKQLFEAERKIRCLSLLEQNVMSKMTCLVLPLNIGENSEVEANDAWLKDFVLAADIEELCEADACVSYYVSGYIGRSITRI